MEMWFARFTSSIFYLRSTLIVTYEVWTLLLLRLRLIRVAILPLRRHLMPPLLYARSKLVQHWYSLLKADTSVGDTDTVFQTARPLGRNRLLSFI